MKYYQKTLLGGLKPISRETYYKFSRRVNSKVSVITNNDLIVGRSVSF